MGLHIYYKYKFEYNHSIHNMCTYTHYMQYIAHTCMCNNHYIHACIMLYITLHEDRLRDICMCEKPYHINFICPTRICPNLATKSCIRSHANHNRDI